MNCYPFIEAEKQGDYSVKRACELLQVSRSAYYADRASRPSRRVQRDAVLTGKIVAIHDESRLTYGSPRVHRELRAQGERCSRKRVARLMQAADRHGRVPRRWKKTMTPAPCSLCGIVGVSQHCPCKGGCAAPACLRRHFLSAGSTGSTP